MAGILDSYRSAGLLQERFFSLLSAEGGVVIVPGFPSKESIAHPLRYRDDPYQSFRF